MYTLNTFTPNNALLIYETIEDVLQAYIETKTGDATFIENELDAIQQRDLYTALENLQMKIAEYTEYRKI